MTFGCCMQRGDETIVFMRLYVWNRVAHYPNSWDGMIGSNAPILVSWER